MKHLFLILTAFALSLGARAQDEEKIDPYDQSKVPLEVEPTNKKLPKIVLIAGSRSHGKGDHEFFAGAAMLMKMLEQNGAAPVMARDGWPKNEKVFEGAKAIMFYCDGGGGHPAVQGERLKVLDGLMKKGVGLSCFHYGVEVEKDRGGPEFLRWIGGYFEAFWSVNPTWMADFKELPKHEITRGVQPFKINDEWYYHMRFPDDMKGVTPILTTIPPDNTRGKEGANDAHGGNPEVQEHKGEPEYMAWAFERPDGARGFGFTGAHYHKNWGNENFRRLAVNAILWTAKVKIPKNGAKVDMDASALKRNLDKK